MTDFGVPCLLIRRTNSKKGAPGGSVTDKLYICYFDQRIVSGLTYLSEQWKVYDDVCSGTARIETMAQEVPPMNHGFVLAANLEEDTVGFIVPVYSLSI